MCKDKSVLQAVQGSSEGPWSAESKDHVLRNDPTHKRGSTHSTQSLKVIHRLSCSVSSSRWICTMKQIKSVFPPFTECLAKTWLDNRNNKKETKKKLYKIIRFQITARVLDWGTICMRAAVSTALICELFRCPRVYVCVCAAQESVYCSFVALCQLSMWLLFFSSEGSNAAVVPDREAGNNHRKDEVKNTSRDIVHQKSGLIATPSFGLHTAVRHARQTNTCSCKICHYMSHILYLFQFAVNTGINTLLRWITGHKRHKMKREKSPTVLCFFSSICIFQVILYLLVTCGGIGVLLSNDPQAKQIF